MKISLLPASTLAIFIVGIEACSDPAPPSCEPLLTDVPVVETGTVGVWEQDGREVELRELWRRGGTREGEELAIPTFPSISRRGRLAIADFQLGEVIVVEPDGTWSGSWTRSGEGPGEVRLPVATTWTADGALVVFDIVTAKVVQLSAPDTFDREWAVDPSYTAPIISTGELKWAGVQPGGSVLLRAAEPLANSAGIDQQLQAVGLDAASEDLRLEVIFRLEPGAEPPDTLSRAIFPVVSAPREGTGPAPGWPLPLAATSAGGRFVVGATDGTYRILVYDASGRPTLQICRDAPQLALSATETGADPPADYAGLGAAIRDAPLPASPQPFGRLILGANGRIWVQRERPWVYPGAPTAMRGVPGAQHDVFAEDGAYLGSVELPESASLQAARGDTIWTFESGPFDEIWVVAYELSGGSP